MMPLTIATVGHAASLDVYSGSLIMIDSDNHATLRIPSPDQFQDHSGDTSYGRSYFKGWAGYIDTWQVPSGNVTNTHLMYMKDVTDAYYIECWDSGIKEFSCIDDVGLRSFDVRNNQIRKLILKNAPNLLRFAANSNLITEMDLSTINPSWQGIYLGSNYLTTLNVTSSGIQDGEFSCNLNQLTSLTFTGSGAGPWNPWNLNCANNKLTSLDLSIPTKMHELDCSNNPLGTLNVSMLPSLDALNCNSCSLTSLNIENTKLANINCDDNLLNVSNIDSILLALSQSLVNYGNATMSGSYMAAPSVGTGVPLRNYLTSRRWYIRDITGEWQQP